MSGTGAGLEAAGIRLRSRPAPRLVAVLSAASRSIFKGVSIAMRADRTGVALGDLVTCGNIAMTSFVGVTAMSRRMSGPFWVYDSLVVRLRLYGSLVDNW